MSTDWQLIDRLLAHQAGWSSEHAAHLPLAEPLGYLAACLQELAKGRKLRTAQTGCGLASVLFAHVAAAHLVYCEDDRSRPHSQVDMVLACPALQRDALNLIHGPAARTVVEQPPQGLLDVVLLDGAKAYPLPESEYFALVRHLAIGGLLVLNDIHIPTLNNLYRILLEEQTLALDRVCGSMAFFRRLEECATEVDARAWWDQGYNITRFPEQAAQAPEAGYSLPFRLQFSARLSAPEPLFVRGFALIDGAPVTVRERSTVRLPMWGPLFGEVQVELEIEPICAEERPGAALEVTLNGGAVVAVPFTNSRRMEISCRAVGRGEQALLLEFRQTGLQYVSLLQGWQTRGRDLHLPGLRLHGVAARALRAPTTQPCEATVRHDGSIISFGFAGERVRFFVDHPEDSVQCHHLAGRFYEEDELRMLASHVPPGAAILDVGANIGNHVVYFEKVMGARRIVAIEPAPQAIELLRINCSLNNLATVDLQHLGIALGAGAQRGVLVCEDSRNPGGTMVRADPAGPVGIEAGDALFDGEHFDLVKVDVEGAELEVLAGLAQLIARCRPALFVEVWDSNRAAFDLLTDSLGYTLVDQWRRYDEATNLLLTWGKWAPELTEGDA